MDRPADPPAGLPQPRRGEPPQAPDGGAPAPDRGVPRLPYAGRWSPAPPVWLESRAPRELGRLRRAPVFAGAGVPRGDGRPVLLVPGFLAGDWSLGTMREWLIRLGHRAALPGLVLNVRYSEAVLRTLAVRLVELYAWCGRPVAIVGHSRGGLLAKVAADRHPEMVDRVITLGSPLADPYDVHPVTMAGVRAAQLFNLVGYGHTSDVERTFLHDLAGPARVPVASIYSRSDGIVHWPACIRDDVDCFEIDGSHLGLAVNPEAYALVARLLARPSRRRPMSAGAPA